MAGSKHLKVTRDRVATAAGVSSATVSRVYNYPEKVAPDKRRLVLNTAKKLGYVPDKNASAMRRSGTGRIVLLEKRGQSGVHTDRIYRWFYADIMSGIRQALDSSMHQLSILAYKDIAEIEKATPAMLGDGAILHEYAMSSLAPVLKHRKHPYVCCCQTEPPSDINACMTDNLLGGREAADVLIASGHIHPAHVTGGLKRNNVCQNRWDGFREAWKGSSVRLVESDLNIDGGRASANRLSLMIKKGQVDSIFVVNDLTAVGVVQGLLEKGIDIPGDVSVIGYDNLPFADILPMKLATIDISFDATYARGTEYLLKSLRTGEPIRERIRPRYMEGRTVRMR